MSTTQRRARLAIESLEKRLLLDGNALAEGPLPPQGSLDLQGETCLQASDSAPAAMLNEADVAAVARSINDFALDLYRELQGQQGNLFLSPFSISTALAMTYTGARGQTATQMADVLRFTLGQDALHPAFGSLIQDLNAAGQAGDYELSVANALWGQANYPFHEVFVNLIQSSYGGGLEQVDFIADAEAARQTINQWIEQQTQERIKDLIPPGVLNEWTRLVLTNAIYFKGQWTSKFDPDDTRDEPFTLASGEQVDARMMHQSGDFCYMESDGFQVLELPYIGDRLSMVVLLPSEAGASGLDASLIPANLDEWLGGLSTWEVIVSLPKFEMTTELQLNGPLEALGMTDAFSPVDADFSGMTDQEQLFIQAVLHKAFVQVNEEGTEAAAATAVVVGAEASPPPPVEFTADHPFHFLIRDMESGSVLFMGRVMEPVWEGEEGAATPTSTDQAEILGPIDFVELAGLDPSAGEILYQIETTRAGYLTLEATYDPAGGTATLTLLDADQQPIATSSSGTGNERIDHQAGGAGEVYFVKLEGTNSQVDLRLGNLVWANFYGTQVTVHGTNAHDTLEYHSDVTPEGLIGAVWRQVAINGLEYTFKVPVALPPPFSLAFDGADGSDTALLYGDADNETILLCPDHGSLEGANYAVTVTGVESITAYGGDGTNVAKLYDDAQAGETLVATPSHAALLGDTFTYRVENFGQVHAYSSGGADVAKLYDDPAQDEIFQVSPEFSTLSNEAFFNRAVGFAYTHAYSRGGTDVAKLYDDPAQDETFEATPGISVMFNDVLFNRAVGFAYTHAYSRGGTDVAKLYDDPARDETFEATPGISVMFNDVLFNRAVGFAYTHAYSRGGTDVAKLYDSPGDDTFVATPDYSVFYNDAFLSRAVGFPYVHGYSSAGADAAKLYDSPAQDTFVGTPDCSVFQNDTFFNRAVGFPNVRAYCFAGLDEAELRDSPGNENLEAESNWATLSYGQSWIRALDFARVVAVSSLGGTDTKHVEAIDYVLEAIGPWIDVP